MPYIITDLCTNDGACVEVCPVACIHTKPGAPQFYIDPEVCIDCEQCEIVCPVDAIFKDVDIPAQYTDYVEINAAFFRQNKASVGTVPFETAWAMIQSAQEYAQMVDTAITAAIVDESGAPIAVGKMDQAAAITAELALSKAHTAAALHVATATLAAQAQAPLMKSLAIAHRGKILPVAGGLPIISGVTIIGAIGIAGAQRPEQDALCCRAGMSVWENAGH